MGFQFPGLVEVGEKRRYLPVCACADYVRFRIDLYHQERRETSNFWPGRYLMIGSPNFTCGLSKIDERPPSGNYAIDMTPFLAGPFLQCPVRIPGFIARTPRDHGVVYERTLIERPCVDGRAVWPIPRWLRLHFDPHCSAHPPNLHARSTRQVGQVQVSYATHQYG